MLRQDYKAGVRDAYVTINSFKVDANLREHLLLGFRSLPLARFGLDNSRNMLHDLVVQSSDLDLTSPASVNADHCPSVCLVARGFREG